MDIMISTLPSIKININEYSINPYFMINLLNLLMMQDLMHHMGLYMAKSRGAKVVDRIII